MMRMGCVLPAANLTADQIEQTVARLSPCPDRLVIVLNDQRSGADLLGPAASESCELVRLDHPVGKAAAVQQGLRVLLSGSPVDVIAQVDGRLKQDPGNLGRLLDRMRNTPPVEMVVADRYGSAILDGHRTALTRLISHLVAEATGFNIRDAVCGMRAYRASLAARFLETGAVFGYGLELWQLLVAASAGASVASVHVPAVTQFPSTASEKLEENFYAFLDHRSRLGEAARLWVCGVLAAIKARRDLHIPGDAIGFAGVFTFENVGAAEDDESSYRVHLRPIRPADV